MTKTDFHQRRVATLQALLIVALGGWVFSPSVFGGWLWDDTRYFPHNPLLHDPDWLWKIWFEPSRFREFYPLTATVQWLQWSWWGNNTLGYHLTSVGLHLFSALLVCQLFSRLGLRSVWIGGLLFALHPLNVESVAWISELKNTLSLPFLLLAMCAYLDFDEKKARRDYLLAAGFFLTSILCKTSVMMFPTVILLHAWWKRGRITRQDLGFSAPFFAISLVMGLLGIWLQRQHDLPTSIHPGWLSQTTTLGLTTFFFLRKFIWPAPLLPDYPGESFLTPTLVDFLPSLLLLGVLGLSWINRAAWGRHVLFGLGFFLLNLVPVMGFVVMSSTNMIWSLDHLVYVPMIGLIALVLAAWNRMCRAVTLPIRYGIFTIGAMVTALMTWESHAYAANFASAEALWTYELRHVPDSAPAHNNLGFARWQQGRLPEAEEQFRQTIRIDSANAEAHNNLGNVLLGEGRYPEAIAQGEEALSLKPRFADAHNLLGNALMLSGRIPEAVAHYQAALKINPNLAEAHNGLANILLKSGQWPEALEQCQQALKINPDYTEAHCNLGLVLAQTGHLPEAIEQFEIARRLAPHNLQIGSILESLRAQPATPPKH